MAFVEGLSFLIILFVTMPLKYMADMPEPNRLIGMIHGILFIAYVAMVILLKKDANWSMKTTFWALLASIVPFGTFVADHKIFKLTEIKSDK
jgi:integral membrane protein